MSSPARQPNDVEKGILASLVAGVLAALSGLLVWQVFPYATPEWRQYVALLVVLILFLGYLLLWYLARKGIFRIASGLSKFLKEAAKSAWKAVCSLTTKYSRAAGILLILLLLTAAAIQLQPPAITTQGPTATGATPTLVVTASAQGVPAAVVVAGAVATSGPGPNTAIPTANEEWARYGTLIGTVWGKDWPKAIALVDEFLAKYPDHREAQETRYAALVQYGQDLSRQGRQEQAREVFDRALGYAGETGVDQRGIGAGAQLTAVAGTLTASSGPATRAVPFTPTPQPIVAPSLTTTPIPTVGTSPTPAATPCLAHVTGGFESVMSTQAYASWTGLLGCDGDGEIPIEGSYQHFVGGEMLYVRDAKFTSQPTPQSVKKILAFRFAAGDDTTGTWRTYGDDYKQGDPLCTDQVPSPKAVTGFGRLWCEGKTDEGEAIKDVFGPATQPECGFELSPSLQKPSNAQDPWGAQQEFAHGWLYFMPLSNRVVWILIDQEAPVQKNTGTYHRVPEPSTPTVAAGPSGCGMRLRLL
jgi:hypothetical protein